MKGGFIKGLLAGAILGGAIALLAAPRKGSETREMLKDKINKLKEDIARKKKELEEMEAKMNESQNQES